jgi:hypothetical protein
MTESEWLASADPTPMLRYLSDEQTSERKMRLLACACCRRIWHLLPDPRSRSAVEVAERFADDRATRLELARARVRAFEAVKGRSGPDWGAYWTTSVKAAGPIWNVFAAASVVDREIVRRTEAEYHADLAGEFLRQVALVYDVIGNPFRLSRLDPHCLAWDRGLVRHLAEGIYEDRAFERMPVLGDALEDAGCSDQNILDHCRSGSEHVRGCWVLDLLLNKQ